MLRAAFRGFKKQLASSIYFYNSLFDTRVVYPSGQNDEKYQCAERRVTSPILATVTRKKRLTFASTA
jgi:hypothetical protein